MLTFGEIRKLVAPYAGRTGKCYSDEQVALFSKQVMENLLISGSHAGVKKLCILAHEGCIAMPPEVETPLKVQIEHRVANVWNKWYSFHSVSDEMPKACLAREVLVEDGTTTPLAYPLPRSGSIVGVMGTCEEDGATISIQGKDPTGRQVYTVYKGEQISGERLTIAKGHIQHGSVVFGEITGIVKPKTNGYVILYAVKPTTGTQTFLADYSPLEEKPSYRRFRIISNKGAHPIVQVSMLCRIRLRDNYHDNELTPFDQSTAVVLTAQRLQAEANNDLQTANYKMKAAEDFLEKEAAYKRVQTGPLDTFVPLSGGAIRNIV